MPHFDGIIRIRVKNAIKLYYVVGKSMVDMLLTNRIASAHFSEEDLRTELLTLLVAVNTTYVTVYTRLKVHSNLIQQKFSRYRAASRML